MPGIGPASIVVLLAELPELGELDRRRIAALVEPRLRPLCDQRSIWGGRADARRTPYMATLTAVRYDPALKICYERLLAAGKRKKAPLGRLHAQAAHDIQRQRKTRLCLAARPCISPDCQDGCSAAMAPADTTELLPLRPVGGHQRG